MGGYCGLGKTDIPPIGCRGFDTKWCQLEVVCHFLKEDAGIAYEQRSENTQRIGENLLSYKKRFSDS